MTAAAAQRLILKGGGSAALGFLIRLGARILFVVMAALAVLAGLVAAATSWAGISRRLEEYA